MSAPRPPEADTGRRGAPAPYEQGARRWLVLGVVLAAAFMILLDATIVNVALPTIRDGLGASDAAVQWVVAGYALAYGLLLIPAGRLASRARIVRTASSPWAATRSATPSPSIRLAGHDPPGWVSGRPRPRPRRCEDRVDLWGRRR